MWCPGLQRDQAPGSQCLIIFVKAKFVTSVRLKEIQNQVANDLKLFETPPWAPSVPIFLSLAVSLCAIGASLTVFHADLQAIGCGCHQEALVTEEYLNADILPNCCLKRLVLVKSHLPLGH